MLTKVSVQRYLFSIKGSVIKLELLATYTVNGITYYHQLYIHMSRYPWEQKRNNTEKIQNKYRLNNEKDN